jgi:DNA-directed RNA polymerase subunit RPC12/RpoP
VDEKMSMTAVIESIERDAFRQVTSKNIGNIENVKIECTTLGEDPIVVADTKEDEEALKKCFYVKLSEHRCSKCKRLLGKFNGQAEIKCPKCGKINRIGVK